MKTEEKMGFKKVFWTLILISTFAINLQADYRDAYSMFFFNRAPSSRAIALGNCYIAVEGDLDSYFFNPAGLANLDEMSVKYSYSSPLYVLDEANYNQVSFGYNFYQNFAGSINYNILSYGEQEITDEEGNTTDGVDSYTSNVNITIANAISKDFSVGAGINYFTENYSTNANTAFFLDIGTIYKPSTNIFKDFTFGASIKNITFSIVDYDSSEEELPVILKIGASNTFTPNLPQQIFEITTMAEYQHVLNYEYRRGLNFGLEFGLAEMFYLRTGYYSHTINDYDFDDNKEQLTELTYGFGVKLPLEEYVNFPIELQVDYANLPHPEYYDESNYSEIDNFNTLTIKLVWNQLSK